MPAQFNFKHETNVKPFFQTTGNPISANLRKVPKRITTTSGDEKLQAQVPDVPFGGNLRPKVDPKLKRILS
jgi:hypothetical protein